MRRRSRRAPNTSESTGKIGQELPSNQPRRWCRSIRDAPSQGRRQFRTGGHARRQERSHGEAPERQAREPRPRRAAAGRDREPGWDPQESPGRLELETQPETPSQPPPEAQAADRSPQAPKGYVVLAIGLPGSGKTTWFRRRGVTPLSSDLLRNILFDDVEEQRYQGLVFSTLRSLLRARLIAQMPWNYVDATNLSIHERRQWIKMAKSFGYEVQAVFFDVPLEVCLDRNRQRDRSVSEDVMRKMAEKPEAAGV